MDTNITGKTTHCKFFFNEDTTTEYRDNLNLLFTYEFVHSFALEIENDIKSKKISNNDISSIDHITSRKL